MQTKKFFELRLDERLISIIENDLEPRGDIEWKDSGILMLRSVRWFWNFIHDDEAEAEYQDHRDLLLNAWVQSDMDVIAPAIHYITNHLIEDKIRWKSLKRLIGEAGEAAHARDNTLKWATCRGRISDIDLWNTWAIILRNFYGALRLSEIIDMTE